MLYITSVGRREVYVTNSETDEVFAVGGNDPMLERCLGYFSGNFICEVDKEVVGLLGYIESLKFVDSRDDAISVCEECQMRVCKYKVMFVSGQYGRIYNLLDFIKNASLHKNFLRMLKSGELVLKVGYRCLSVKFCGDYMPYIRRVIGQ